MGADWHLKFGETEEKRSRCVDENQLSLFPDAKRPLGQVASVRFPQKPFGPTSGLSTNLPY